MAGLPLNAAVANQDWANLLYTACRSLADCNGVNDLINDANRNPGLGSAGLQANLGMTANDAGLYVASFAAISALWKHSTNVQAAAMTNFWFQAQQLFGTKPMPK